MTAQDSRAQEQVDPRAIALRLGQVAGVLLALDLAFLPWHRFNLVTSAGVDGANLDRSGIQSPKAALGILALVLAVVLAVSATLDPIVRARLSSASRSWWERMPQFVGSATAVLLLLKLVLEPDSLGPGAWLGVILAAALGYAGFALGQGALPGGASGVAKPGSARAVALQRQQQERQRWLLLALVVLVVSVAAVWQGSDEEELASTVPVSLTLGTTGGASSSSAPGPDSSTPVTGADGSVLGEPGASATAVTAPTDPAPPGAAGTRLVPAVTETGGTVTATAAGAPPGRQFVLKLGRSQDDCGRNPLELGADTSSGDDGTIGPVSAVVPLNTTPGRYFGCFAQVDDPDTTTPATELFVT